MDEYALELEYRFINGDSLYETILEGRDRIVTSPAEILVDISVSPTESVSYIIERKELNYRKVTRRKLEPEKLRHL